MSLNELEEWLKHNQVYDKDAAEELNRPRNVFVKKTKKIKRKSLYSETLADSEIDLHNLTLEEALFKTESELELAIKSKWKIVRIVHGVGKTSGGIIRKELEKKFRGEWKNKVKEYRYERNNRGSSLAIL